MGLEGITAGCVDELAVDPEGIGGSEEDRDATDIFRLTDSAEFF